jgi:N-acetylmuramoyl-L-alanine amidase
MPIEQPRPHPVVSADPYDPLMRRRTRGRIRFPITGAGLGLLLLVSGCAAGSAPAPPASTTPAPSPSGAAQLRSLAGAVVVLDPGHDGGNGRHPNLINRTVPTPLGPRPCDTAGTETVAGYPEHAFTWDLAHRLAQLLTAAGAHVVLTRTGDDGVGPCTVDRARIGNQAAGPGRRVVVAISIHADGGPPGGEGFHVIEPGPAGPNDAMVAPSRRLGGKIRDAFRAGTGEPYAGYVGTDGIAVRTDLGGLNLSTVPKVFIECGNMRNAQDAARLGDPGWRQRAAVAVELGLAGYLAPT